jgi:hypothetical protein
MSAAEVFAVLSKGRLPCDREVDLQDAVEWLLKSYRVEFIREHDLTGHGRVDFMCGDVAVEIKVNGSARAIYRQCRRYCECPEVKALILVTNKTIGLPEEINGKPCRVLSVGKAWL